MSFLIQDKTNWRFIVIVVFLATVVAMGILGYSKMMEEEFGIMPADIPEKEIEDETAGWLTYRNEEYGFEIKYPEDWEEHKFPGEINKELFDISFMGPTLDSSEIFMQGSFRILVWFNSNKLHLEEWMEEYRRETASGADLIQEIADTMLDKRNAKEVSVFGFDSTITEIITIDNNFIYKLIFYDYVIPEQDMHDVSRYREAYEQNYRNQQIYKKMISTFRFIEEAEEKFIEEEAEILDIGKVDESVETEESEEPKKADEEIIIEESENKPNKKYNNEIKKELSACETFQCYAKVAIRLNDYFICEKLADEDGLYAPGWIPSCFAFIAVEKNEEQICNLIDELIWPSKKEQCYLFVEKEELLPWAVE